MVNELNHGSGNRSNIKGDQDYSKSRLRLLIVRKNSKFSREPVQRYRRQGANPNLKIPIRYHASGAAMGTLPYIVKIERNFSNEGTRKRQ